VLFATDFVIGSFGCFLRVTPSISRFITCMQNSV